MKYPFPFDAEKGIEAVAYIAHRLAMPTLHSVFKILYFADLKHLARYGLLISDDNYVAMKHGPVPSKIYDIAKAVRDNGGFVPGEVAAYAKGAFQIDGQYRIRLLREPDEDKFSESDLECMDETVKEHGGKSFQELTALSHDAAWESADENDYIGVEQMVGALADSDMPAGYDKAQLIDYLRDPFK
jgi:uncharacterized phage-associated protein